MWRRSDFITAFILLGHPLGVAVKLGTMALQLLIILHKTVCSLHVLQKHTPELIAKILKWRKQGWHTALPGSVLHLFLKAKMKNKAFIYLFDARHVSVIASQWISCTDFGGHQMKLQLSSRTFIPSKAFLVR